MPTTILYILLILLAFAVAYFSTPVAIKIAFKLGAIDKPDQRKVHQQTMPRLGGLAFFVAFIIATLVLSWDSSVFNGILLGGIIIFLVGMLDDIYQLSPWVKLIGQCLAAVTAMYFGVIVHFVTNPFDGLLSLGYLSLPLTFLWIVGVTNAINLIDGLDGLAGGVSAIAAATMGIVSLLHGQTAVAVTAFILVAAIAGFLPYNFHPARTFMGDGGSNFLGFVLACLAIMGTAKSAALISLFVPIVILGIPIFDTFFAIIRRIHKRAPIFMPDKDHLHHRLMALGMSHRRSVLIIYGISAFFGGVAVTLSFTTSPKASLVLALLLLVIVIGADRIGMFTGQPPQLGTQVAKPPRHVEM
ncbi:MAG: glycosyltransferase family 4 protein [Syntrophomonadaceae bacterium]|jgi:UDP-GlcNAc:undecaprenyl-phosphate GlcNAc-1-phosphate transferase|nr:MraY family glycosyltransferase [Bacillota bacterium]NLP24627.1 undecaprenyl/decaprenyl-phosphate alpha-N-acetylglucosaminyl 1-phosphate transferase [Syntrophomonadaceae bacterium]